MIEYLIPFQHAIYIAWSKWCFQWYPFLLALHLGCNFYFRSPVCWDEKLILCGKLYAERLELKFVAVISGENQLLFPACNFGKVLLCFSCILVLFAGGVWSWKLAAWWYQNPEFRSYRAKCCPTHNDMVSANYQGIIHINCQQFGTLISSLFMKIVLDTDLTATLRCSARNAELPHW